MTYKISKQLHFSASHRLPKLPEGHPCKRWHGHNYIIELVLESDELDKFGFVIDYKEVDQLKLYLDTAFDHRTLNDIIDNPTAENLAKHLFDFCSKRWPQTTGVRVSETPKTWAEYRK